MQQVDGAPGEHRGCSGGQPLDSLIRSLEKTPMGIYWTIVIFCLVGTYLYLWRVQKVKKQAQLLIILLASRRYSCSVTTYDEIE